MTQKDVTNALETHKGRICMYETGKIIPSLDTLIKLADIFQVSLDYLVTGQKIDNAVRDKDLMEIFKKADKMDIIDRAAIIKVLRPMVDYTRPSK